MTDPLFDFDNAVCPVGPATDVAAVSAADVAAGRATLAQLTGRFLPVQPPSVPDLPASYPGGGVTVVKGGGGTPIVTKDYVKQGGNTFRGYLGEQDAAFVYAVLGFPFNLKGAGGAAGKSSSANGADNMLYSPVSAHLILNDNKSAMSGVEVTSCTALNENLMDTLRRAREDNANLRNFADQSIVDKKLGDAIDAIGRQDGSRLPDGFGLEVSNAGGRAINLDADLIKNFEARWSNVFNADGSTFSLGWRAMQPPESVQAQNGFVAEVSTGSTTSTPYSALVATNDAFILPTQAAASTAAYEGPTLGALEVARLLLPLAKAAARAAGFVEHDPLVESLNNQLGTVVVPHLVSNPGDGALISVSFRTKALDAEGNESEQPPFAMSLFGSTPGELFRAILATPVIGDGDANLSPRHYWYLWVKNGAVTPYFPGQDATNSSILAAPVR
jgi:hypothetical protein